jgi:hypothetical protein
MVRHSPEIKLASSLARKEAAPAISSGVPSFSAGSV